MDTPLPFFKSLADDTRLKALLLISQAGEMCVCDIQDALALSQPKVSRHLAELRKSGLVADERRGKWVYYRINPALPDWARSILSLTADHNADYLPDIVQSEDCCSPITSSAQA